MKIFLSWSGIKSKAVAETLKNWIPQIIQAVDPWISVDIDKGRRWSSEISNQLEESRFGVICLTRDNLESTWIHFEAGALSKTKDAYVWTLLLDIKPADVQPPLGSFQHTTRAKDDIRKLVHTINSAVQEEGERGPSETILNSLFDKLWSELEEQLQKIAAQPSAVVASTRSDSEILQEILEIVRTQDRSQSFAVSTQSAASLALEKRLTSKTAQALEDAIRNRIKSGAADAEIIAAAQNIMPSLWIEQKIIEIRDELNSQVFDELSGVEMTIGQKTSKSRGRKINNLEELVELWPTVLARVKRKIGVTAVAYLQDSTPVLVDEKQVVLEFERAFHREKAVEAAARLPFQQVLNECLSTPHDLNFRLAGESP